MFLIPYLMLQMGIGIWISRSVKTESDYFLGGRSLNLFLASMSMFASWFGAETCMGSASAIYSQGLGGSRADPFGYTICLILFAVLLAGQLRRLKLTTLGDLYGIRYSKVIERMAVLIMIPTSILWAGAQIRAFGQILAVVSPIDPAVAVTVATAFVICYTFLGGVLGDVATDVLQGTVLMIGLLVLLIACIGVLGGPSEALSSIQPEQLLLIRPGETVWQRLDTWAVPVLGSLVAQEMVSRTLATRTSRIARNSSLVAAALYLAVGLIPVTIGLLGPHILTDSGHADQFLPKIAMQLLPPFLLVIVIGALISAILSTVDTTVLTVSAFMTHNVLGETYWRLSEPTKLRVSRYFVIVTGLIAYILALSSDSIYELVQESSSFGSAGVLVITLAGLWWRGRGGNFSAGAALVAGVLSTLVFKWYWEVDAPYIAAIVVSLVTYVAVAIFERKPAQGEVISRRLLEAEA